MFGFLERTKPEGTKITLQVVGMHCTSCALTIDDALEEQSGVHSANTNFARGIVEVYFDPSQVAVDDLIVIIRQQGYEVRQD